MALILIVDDSPTEVFQMTKALERAGYKVEVAADGAEALLPFAARALPRGLRSSAQGLLRTAAAKSGRPRRGGRPSAAARS